MRRFKWNDWNRWKVDVHRLTPDEVEASFERVIRIRDRDDGSYVMEAETPSGREIKVIWRYDRIHDDIPDFMGEFDDPPIFVITAY